MLWRGRPRPRLHLCQTSDHSPGHRSRGAADSAAPSELSEDSLSDILPITFSGHPSGNSETSYPER